ncbi:hypothetical protein VNO77_27552 [Canavalia gladiata]|uniref:Uncharacterized protein n=1 Tax=Canavalia gladiata TaxID=3824 RepID=A0AAN9KW05_CANGL
MEKEGFLNSLGGGGLEKIAVRDTAQGKGYSLESWLRWELKRLIRQEIDLNQGRRKAGEVAISVSNINSGLVVRQISDQSILHSARVDLLRICWGSYGGHLHQGYPCIRIHGRANNRGDITDVRGWLGSRHGKRRFERNREACPEVWESLTQKGNPMQI